MSGTGSRLETHRDRIGELIVQAGEHLIAGHGVRRAGIADGRRAGNCRFQRGVVERHDPAGVVVSLPAAGVIERRAFQPNSHTDVWRERRCRREIVIQVGKDVVRLEVVDAADREFDFLLGFVERHIVEDVGVGAIIVDCDPMEILPLESEGSPPLTERVMPFFRSLSLVLFGGMVG